MKKSDQSRRQFIAGVSAFGLTGINAHAVLEAPPVSAAPNDVRQSVRGASLLCQYGF